MLRSRRHIEDRNREWNFQVKKGVPSTFRRLELQHFKSSSSRAVVRYHRNSTQVSEWLLLPSHISFLWLYWLSFFKCLTYWIPISYLMIHFSWRCAVTQGFGGIHYSSLLNSQCGYEHFWLRWKDLLWKLLSETLYWKALNKLILLVSTIWHENLPTSHIFVEFL